VAETTLITIMTQILQEQRNAMTDANAARALATTPKTVREHFKPFLTNRLLIMCQVPNQTDLPELWKEILLQAMANASGKP
jgi:hypothetical protein